MNTKQEVMENLLLADQYFPQMFPKIKSLKLVVAGGASFLLKGFESKFTLDIDTISKVETDVLEYLESFSINDAALEVIKLSPSYEKRMVRLDSECKVIDIYVLSNEDLVISKVGRSDPKDFADIEDSGILNHVDISLMNQLADEIAQVDLDFKKKWGFFSRTILGG